MSRRFLLLRAALLVVLLALVSGAPAAPTPPAAQAAQGPAAEAVVSVGMTVGDMERSVRFFSEVLDFEKVSDVEATGEDLERLEGVFGLRMRVVRMRLGDEILELSEYLAPKGRPIPVDSRSNDRWFQHVAIIVSDMDRAYARLRERRVEHASSGPQRLPDWNKSAGGIRAFYFKDPDDHTLEILEFPPDKGASKWHRSDGRLFLGIDHTAIVVSDTEASLRVYRDLLGFRVAGESENYGPEQEHLNNVFGARLRITSLRVASGPGVELLEYLAPSDGRPAPADLRASDVAFWQTRLRLKDPEALTGRLRLAGCRLVSPGAVDLGRETLGLSKAVLARDPDGHALLLATGDMRRSLP